MRGGMASNHAARFHASQKGICKLFTNERLTALTILRMIGLSQNRVGKEGDGMIWLEEKFLLDAVKMEKLYRSCVKEAASGYQFSPNEISVLLFLRRYAPERDTATDIVQQLGISKALVARSVEGLHRRGFVQGERDENDRRIVHLHLCGEGITIAQQLYQTGCRVVEQLRRDVSEEEMRLVQHIMEKMQHNLDVVLKDMEEQVK